jgi:hypothetical protein
MMMSSALFCVTEYAQRQSAISPVYESLAMCLHDASRFAAALSYARGAYVHVTSQETPYQEWWFAGAIWNQADVPPIGGVR